jgi:enamine deaminase RidA (YjgF/YER057c/UK114 family)
MRYQTENQYEKKFGYARAVRHGPFVFVSGTTSIDPTTGELLHPTSAYHQTKRIFQEIITAVEAVGGNKANVARVRMFVTYGEDAEDVGRALLEAFGDIEPAATMIVGAKFILPQMLVEIEADAVILE